MGGASSWYAMMSIAAFLVAVWSAGKASKMVGMSSIIFEELTTSYADLSYDCDTKLSKYQAKVTNEGNFYCDLKAYVEADKYDDYWGKKGSVTYNAYWAKHNWDKRRLSEEDYAEVDEDSDEGRRLAKTKKGKTDFDTYTKCIEDTCTLKQALDTATVPDIFTLAGHIGVGMMIFESGMHFDFEQAKTVGPWASAVAVLGTFLPIIAGTGLSLAYGFGMTASLSAGVSLAPTSVGIALKLLHEADALSEYFGQAVMTAAFVDDVLSLIIFSVLFTVGGGDPTFLDFVPLILGCVFMAIAIPAAVLFWPRFLNFVFSKIPETKPDAKVTRHEEVMFIILFATLCIYGQITHLCGTHLWGCFIAGMSFATRHEAHHVWVRQVKRYTSWALRIFFACTLAWSIPVEALFDPMAFLKGSVMGIVACIGTKVFCAPFMGAPRWVIGWAMVGRAEFAYFIAIFAKSLKMMPDELFAILIWSLLYATIFAPLVFRTVLARYMARLGKREAAERVSRTSFQISEHLPDAVEVERQHSKEAHELALQKKLSAAGHDKDDAEERAVALEKQLKAMEEYMEVLRTSMQEAGVAVPPDPVAPPAGEENGFATNGHGEENGSAKDGQVTVSM